MALAARSQRTRMMWYFDNIIDFMIANPGCTNEDIGAYVRRAPTTISIIRNSDMFKAHYASRRQEFSQTHDFALIHKSTKVAEAALDAILTTLQNKKDTVPLARLESIAQTSLKTLGYGLPSGPQTAVTVNNNNSGNKTVVLPSAVSSADLEEARMAIRQAEKNKLIEHQASPPQGPLLELEVTGAGLQEEDIGASTPLSD